MCIKMPLMSFGIALVILFIQTGLSICQGMNAYKVVLINGDGGGPAYYQDHPSLCLAVNRFRFY